MPDRPFAEPNKHHMLSMSMRGLTHLLGLDLPSNPQASFCETAAVLLFHHCVWIMVGNCLALVALGQENGLHWLQ